MRGTRRVVAVLGAAAVLVLAGIGLWQAGQDRPATLEQRTDAIAAELGCPTCEAQSVATSHSEIAAAMRTEIGAQLAAGRTPEQIRAWFADRYGPSVLLEPPAAGVGLVVWLVPVVLLAAGSVLFGVVVRRRAPTAQAPDPPASAASRARPLVAVAVLAVAAVGAATWAVSSGALAPGATRAEAAGTAAASPSDPDAWLARGAALEAEQAYAPSAEAYRRAVELRPEDLRARVRLGLVLLKAGEPAEAEAVSRAILAARPEHPEGLLVHGLAQRSRGAPEAPATLHRFLDTAPAHPAAPEVRRLLGSR